MHILKRIACTIIAAVWGTSLVSCVGGHSPMEPDALQARGLQPGEGYIVAVFNHATLDSKTAKITPVLGSSPSLSITPASGQGFVNLLPRVTKTRDLTPEGAPGDVVAVPVPAGDYAITGWSMWGRAVTADVTVSNRIPFKAPFQVKPGEATYLGRVNSLSRVGRNLFGMPIFAGGMIMVSDEFAKDQPRIGRIYPSIKPGIIKRSSAPAAYQKEMDRIASTPDDRNILQKLLRVR